MACDRSAPGARSTEPVPTPRVDSGVAGVLHDAAGRPLGNERVLACMSSVCFTGESGADGRFTFRIDAPAQLVIKTDERVSAGPRRAAALLPVQLSEKRLLDIGVVHTPDLPDGPRIGAASADPQTLQAGDGLELTLRRSALTPRLGEVVVDLAARRLTPSQTPRYAALSAEEVIAVYALHPFAAKSASPIAVKAPSDLPAGTPVRFRTIDEMNGTFSAAVPGRASGTFVSTDPGAGITELTYLVISR